MFCKIEVSTVGRFICVYDPEMKLKNQIPKNLDKLEDALAAKERGFLLENNQIYTAYQCQDEPNIR